MRSFFWRVLFNGLALLLLDVLVGWVHISSIPSAFIAALVLGVLNAIIRPLLLLLTLPLNIMTLGLFTLVINGVVLWIVVNTVKGVSIGNFWQTVICAVLLSIISWIISWLLGKPDKKQHEDRA